VSCRHKVRSVRTRCQDRWALVLVLMLAISGCATWQSPADPSVENIRARAVSETSGDVDVRAAILSAEDTRRIFGADLNATGVQVVWVEVDNRSSVPLRFLHTGTDPNYYSPLEVAWSLHVTFGGATNDRIDDYFDAKAFPNPIPSKQLRRGFIFTNPEPIVKLFNVDLVGNRIMVPFTLILPVPDSPLGEEAATLSERVAAVQGPDYQTEQALRAALEDAPCCTRAGADKAISGPVNVVMVGMLGDLGSALVRRGYRRDLHSDDLVQRVYARPPDIVMRKHAQGSDLSNWVRAWVAPFRYQGRPVFLCQVGRPVGGRFAKANDGPLVLQSDVDEARNHFVGDMLYSGGLEQLGFVEGGSGDGDATVAVPKPYQTDGLRAVFVMATRPLSLSETEFLDWVPYIRQRETEASALATE